MNEEPTKVSSDQGSSESPGEASEQPSATEALTLEQCAEQLAQKEEAIKQLQDRVLRLAAETENTRKRLERERSDGICFANESLMRDLLPVLDNLERAIQHSEQGADLGGLMEGVRMTAKGFSDVLAKFGCLPFGAVGQVFDPRYHEAMAQQEAPGPENTVLLEYQKGYKLHERLLRPAMVVVSKAPKNEAAGE